MAISIATVEGEVADIFGVSGTAADIASIITIALRTINKIGVCYGYETKTKEDRDFIMEILNLESRCLQ